MFLLKIIVQDVLEGFLSWKYKLHFPVTEGAKKTCWAMDDIVLETLRGNHLYSLLIKASQPEQQQLSQE